MIISKVLGGLGQLKPENSLADVKVKPICTLLAVKLTVTKTDLERQPHCVTYEELLVKSGNRPVNK